MSVRSSAISSTVLGNPQIVQPASQVNSWSTGRRVMKVPASPAPPASPEAPAPGVTKNVTPTSS